MLRKMEKCVDEDCLKREPYVILISNMETFDREASAAVEKAQTSWDGITSVEYHNYGMARQTERFEKAIQRGVKFRHLLFKPKEEQYVTEVSSSLKDPTSWEIRYLSNVNPLSLIILDKQEVFVSIENEDIAKTKKARWLRTNSPCILAMAKDCFETKWAATESPS